MLSVFFIFDLRKKIISPQDMKKSSNAVKNIGAEDKKK